MNSLNVLIFFSLVQNGITYRSTYLDMFRRDFGIYETKLKDTLGFVSKVLYDKNREIEKSLRDIDNILPVISNMTDIMQREKIECNITEKYMEQMRASLKMDIEVYSLTLTEIMNDLQNKVYEVKTLIDLYSSIAQNKEWSCKLFSTNCTSETEIWVEGVKRELLCRVVTECTTHNITKRSTKSDCSGFRCKNGQCISAGDVCTGIYTCADRSDEMPGCKLSCVDGFHCKNKVCIDKNEVCNHKDDCGDNSDEEDCIYGKEKVCSVEYGRYQCANNDCIDLDRVCNGVDDCLDGSDEGSGCKEYSCGGNNCTSAGNICLPMPKGAVCMSHCPSNMIESRTGCLPQQNSYGSTIGQILDDIPFSVQRFMVKVKYRRLAYYREIRHIADSISECLQQPIFTTLQVTDNATRNG